MFPPPPAAHIDWTALGLTNQPAVNGHVECRYRHSTGAWTAPTFTTSPHIPVHGLAPGLNYGQQCYEGLKAFRTPANTLQVFRPAFHAQRLARSASYVCLPAVPEALFLECVRLAIARNAEFVPPASAGGFMYVRPLVFGSGPSLALAPPDEVCFAVFVAPGNPYHGAAALDALVLEEFDRCAPRGTGAAKVGGNYAPVWRHQMRARERGYGITLHLDSATRRCVEEFSTSGFVGVRGQGEERRVMVVPATANAIESATSDSLVRLAEREGWVVRREEVPFDSLPSFDEVLAVGTAAAAVPIRSITRESTEDKFVFKGSSGAPGTRSAGLELAKMMSDIQRGLAPDEFGWCWQVQGDQKEEQVKRHLLDEICTQALL